MVTLQQLVGILGLSFASGVNLYLAVLVVGLAERFHWVTGLPPELGVLSHALVLMVAGVLFLLEFFADKIPFVTTVWDVVHTIIRPAGGALLALGAAGHLQPGLQAAAALAGGGIALGTHGTKMGVRILAHAAPEPATHSLVSVTEDLGVVGLLSLVYLHPYVAIPVLLGLLALIALLLPLVLRLLNFLAAGLAGKARSWMPGMESAPVPNWAGLVLKELDPAGPLWIGEAYAGQVKGVPRLKPGYLARMPGQWVFVHRGLGRAKAVPMDASQPAAVGLDRYFLWDSLNLAQKGGVQNVLLTKDHPPDLPLGTDRSGCLLKE
jgi:hypothetical protein